MRRQLGGLRAYNYVSDGSCGANLAAYVLTLRCMPSDRRQDRPTESSKLRLLL